MQKAFFLRDFFAALCYDEEKIKRRLRHEKTVFPVDPLPAANGGTLRLRFYGNAHIHPRPH
jgi:hypothetical protein